MQGADLWQDVMKVSATLLGTAIVVMTFLFGFKGLKQGEGKGVVVLSLGPLLMIALVLFYSILVVSDWATITRLEQMFLLYLLFGLVSLVVLVLAVTIGWFKAS